MPFKNGDLVWAKMKGFPPWPGLVSEPPDGLMEGTFFKKDVKYSCIYFFGTRNYGFIEHNQLKPYLPYKEQMLKISKSTKFKQACLEIEEHCNKDQATTEEKKISLLLNSDGIDAETKSENSEVKRVLASPKKVTKKRKHSNFSDADTTTPLDAMCQSSFNTNDNFSKEETSIHSSDEHSAEEEDEEEEEDEKEDCNNDSVEATDISSGEIVPSTLKIGFIGIGVMGKILVHRLLQDGHELIIWNRSPEKLTDFQTDGVKIASSPAEVVVSSRIIFCCVADGAAAKNVMFSQGGIMLFMSPEKSFVDLSSSDVQSSLDISEAVFSRGSRYLEVRLHGSKKEAEEGSLICLTAGDESLHNDCQFFYQSCSKQSFFMGETGNASRFYLVMQSVAGVALAGLAECMALADRAGLDQNDLLNILKISQINCPLIVDKASAMVNNDYSTKMALRNVQNDLQSVIAIGEEIEQPTPVTATANEIFKHAKKVGYGGHDVSAIYLGSKF